MTARCKGCGHIFYDDAPVKNGLCKWCVGEGGMPERPLQCSHSSSRTVHDGYGNYIGWECTSCGYFKGDEDD